MKTAQEFIKAISKINWSNHNHTSFTSENGFTLSWSTKFHDKDFLPSVQIVAQVRYKDSYVMTWGFTDDASQRQFIAFMNKTKFRIDDEKFTKSLNEGELGLALLEGYSKVN